MSRKLTLAQIREKMTPPAPTRERLEAEVQFAEHRLQRAGGKLAVADAEYHSAAECLEERRDALAAFITANPDPQYSIL